MEVQGICFIFVGYTKIVDDQGEGDGVGGMSPQAIGVWRLPVPKFGQAFGE